MPDSSYTALPEHVTMPLLDLVTRQSLDQDYASVAARRERAGDEASKGPGRAAVLAALSLFGLLVVTAAVQETRDAPVDQTNRAGLIGQINDRRDSLGALQDRIGERQARITALQQEAGELTTQEAAAQDRLDRLLSRTGYGPVRGPGVRILVDDSPSGIADEAVRDSDLADLVNALWAVGAEAISINGERLTVLSGIRNVDVAIHVNGKPLSPPYVVEAIGDPRTMQADLVNSPRGAHFLALADALGLVYDLSNQQQMTLPGTPLGPLRSARATGGVDNGAAGSDDDTPEKEASP